MQTNISIKNLSEESIIEIEGTIGIPEEWQFEHPDERVATYEKFRRMVAEISDLETARIVVNIRSTGGDVNDALLIYEALRSTEAEITTRCYGYTASAATIIAQAASEGCREVMGGALYLIHNSISAVEGNAEELAAHTDLLRKTDERLAEIYSQRSGRPAEEFALLMAENNGRGRWLSPEEVLEAGLCDKVVESYAPRKNSLTQNVATGLKRLGRALFGVQGEEPIEDRNILHLHPSEEAPRSVIAHTHGQQRPSPTSLQAVEDPSLREQFVGANAEAYASDLRRIIHR